MDKKEFLGRRKSLMDIIGKGGLAILSAAPEKVRSRDTFYDYRQDSDFYYLTGFEEPDSVAVLIPDRLEGEFILFCREKDQLKEVWDGAREGNEGAVRNFGADDSFPISDIADILPGLIEQSERVYFSMGDQKDFDQNLMGWIHDLHSGRHGHRGPTEIIDLGHVLHEMRLFKSKKEINLMKKSAKIALDAHSKAMSICKPGLFEYEIEAEFLREFKRRGADCSYPPIVASGNNACVLHYTDNSSVLNDGDLILIDAGCEYQFYASDITRTFPINGIFSEPQREIYEIVYSANQEAIKKVKAGNHWDDPHNIAVKEITKGLKSLGIISGSLKSLIKEKAYHQFFMHKTGHWLGIDVHDVGDYKVADKWRLLEPGMVTTVEPGIYISNSSKGVKKHWKGIGIRIEDDVCVTKNANIVFSQSLPSQAEDIENFMRSFH
ncbi:MAG: Xaa-Pro aminopeptidase [Gammaproteobacteria bacterium TMED78]|nr:MAG: Xaa-Pro aminopeptidase [Gammaproteobacteria bacterium TMED78]|tara:strand:+ start:2417 stop:3724 length:1308 start_codon:yes stop_codon:yes gene_type:complete